MVLSENYWLSHMASGIRRKTPVLTSAQSFGEAPHSWQMWDNTHFTQAEKYGGATVSSQQNHSCISPIAVPAKCFL